MRRDALEIIPKIERKRSKEVRIKIDRIKRYVLPIKRINEGRIDEKRRAICILALILRDLHRPDHLCAAETDEIDVECRDCCGEGGE